MTATPADTLRIPGQWKIDYQYTVGTEAAAFFDGLRRGEMLGSKCARCSEVSVPPRAFCEKCFVHVSQMVPVGLTGVIAAATVVTTPFEGSPDVPYCVAYVTLAAAATAVANYVREIELDTPIAALPAQLAPGAHVEVRFADERQGRLSDFWFVPARNGEA